MDVAIVLLFFGLVTVLGLCPGFRTRSKKENIFYIASIVVSFAILLLGSLDFPLWDPVSLLVKACKAMGL